MSMICYASPFPIRRCPLNLLITARTVSIRWGICSLRTLFIIFTAGILRQIFLKSAKKSANMEIAGFIGKPLISRGNRAYENYFINGRYIKSPVITKAIEEAYKNFVMVHKYPFTAFHLKIDASFIDVNVHPTKMEIRFNNGRKSISLFTGR